MCIFRDESRTNQFALYLVNAWADNTFERKSNILSSIFENLFPHLSCFCFVFCIQTRILMMFDQGTSSETHGLLVRTIRCFRAKVYFKSRRITRVHTRAYKYSLIALESHFEHYKGVKCTYVDFT